MCLHIRAESGQLHLNLISDGLGKSPVSCWHRRSITDFEKSPFKSSTKESIAPPTSWQTDCQRGFGVVTKALNLVKRPGR